MRPIPDKILSAARAAKQSDLAKGTGPRRNTPKSFHEVPSVDAAAPAPPEASTAPDLHSALMSVGDQLLQHHDKVASLASIGHSLKQVALKIAPQPPDIGPSVEPTSGPEIGADTSGLFGEET